MKQNYVTPLLILCSFFLICSAEESFVIKVLRALGIYLYGHPFESIYKDTPTIQNEMYDFIIIGSGPSGSVVANRLSKVPGIKSLLLEAGGEPGVISDVPAACPFGQFSAFDWGYRTEKENGYCWGCENRNMQWGHGKVLGGTSVINFMIYVHGNRYDYDEWASLGNPGWSYEEVLPHFLRVEDSHLSRIDAEYHGYDGELTVSDVPFREKISEVYIKAAEEAGYDYTDYNGAKQLGVSYVQATLRDGSRCSAEKAFLRPIRENANVNIQKGARVMKILINPENGTAFGVEFYKNGMFYKAFARKEVILSAGALNSPQILMLSGIGPRDHLASLGIPIIRDLPVGRKMYDHATYLGLIVQVDEWIVVDLPKQVANISNLLAYALQGKGTFTSIGSVETLTYMKTEYSADKTPRPDMEFIQLFCSIGSDGGLIFRKMFNIPDDTYEKFWKPYANQPVFQIVPMLLHPRSVGHIELRSKNPFDSPKFYPNYFSDPSNLDIKTFIAAIREIQRILQSPALQKYGARLIDKPLPGCESKPFDSDEYWECCLRTLPASLWHQFSTCKMGPSSDREAVVDHELKVHGVKGLRVIDTSVIPITLSGHNVGVAYMIGEKGASLIKKSWNL